MCKEQQTDRTLFWFQSEARSIHHQWQEAEEGQVKQGFYFLVWSFSTQHLMKQENSGIYRSWACFLSLETSGQFKTGGRELSRLNGVNEWMNEWMNLFIYLFIYLMLQPVLRHKQELLALMSLCEFAHQCEKNILTYWNIPLCLH